MLIVLLVVSAIIMEGVLFIIYVKRYKIMGLVCLCWWKLSLRNLLQFYLILFSLCSVVKLWLYWERQAKEPMGKIWMILKATSSSFLLIPFYYIKNKNYHLTFYFIWKIYKVMPFINYNKINFICTYKKYKITYLM